MKNIIDPSYEEKAIKQVIKITASLRRNKPYREKIYEEYKKTKAKFPDWLNLKSKFLPNMAKTRWWPLMIILEPLKFLIENLSLKTFNTCIYPFKISQTTFDRIDGIFKPLQKIYIQQKKLQAKNYLASDSLHGVFVVMNSVIRIENENMTSKMTKWLGDLAMESGCNRIDITNTSNSYAMDLLKIYLTTDSANERYYTRTSINLAISSLKSIVPENLRIQEESGAEDENDPDNLAPPSSVNAYETSFRPGVKQDFKASTSIIPACSSDIESSFSICKFLSDRRSSRISEKLVEGMMGIRAFENNRNQLASQIRKILTEK